MWLKWLKKLFYRREKNTTPMTPPHSEEPGEGLLTNGDVSRIATAIAQGITKSREKPTKAKIPWWPVLIAIFVLAAALGIWGFNTRPPQSVTFSGTFVADSELHVRASHELTQIVSGTVSGLEVSGYDKPIKLALYMTPTQKEEFISALRPEWIDGGVAILDGPAVKLDFAQPTRIYVTANAAGEISMRKEINDSGTTIVVLTVKTQKPSGSASDGPDVNITVYPPDQGTYSFQVKRFDQIVGNFTMEPVLISKESKLLLEVSTRPYSREAGEIISFSFATSDCTLEATTNGPEDLEDQQHLEIRNLPDGLLSLGNLVKSLGAGDSLKIEFNSSESITLKENRINIYTDKKSCVSAVVNGRTELLPSQFSTWPSVWQELYRWLAITVTTTSVLGILRRYSNLPS